MVDNTRGNLPTEDEVTFASRAKLGPLSWIPFNYPPEGSLMLAGDRLIFVRNTGVGLGTEVSRISKLKSPWYQLGQGFTFVVDGRRYLCNFNKLSSARMSGLLLQSGNPLGERLGLSGDAGDLIDISSAYSLCKAWKQVLKAAMKQMVATGEAGERSDSDG
jgi:hypothetical protein